MIGVCRYFGQRNDRDIKRNDLQPAPKCRCELFFQSFFFFKEFTLEKKLEGLNNQGHFFQKKQKKKKQKKKTTMIEPVDDDDDDDDVAVVQTKKVCGMCDDFSSKTFAKPDRSCSVREFLLCSEFRAGAARRSFVVCMLLLKVFDECSSSKHHVLI